MVARNSKVRNRIAEKIGIQVRNLLSKDLSLEKILETGVYTILPKLYPHVDLKHQIEGTSQVFKSKMAQTEEEIENYDIEKMSEDDSQNKI